MKKNDPRGSAAIKRFIIALGGELLWLFAGICVLAILVSTEKTYESAEIWVERILLVSTAFWGPIILWKNERKGNLVLAVLETGALFVVLIFAGMLFFEGELSGMIERIVLIVSGTFLGAVAASKAKGGREKKSNKLYKLYNR